MHFELFAAFGIVVAAVLSRVSKGIVISLVDFVKIGCIVIA